jgi:2',3'-cyclic-nucleotide 2'-phosphodiesterase (5'-nucleotidase family)
MALTFSALDPVVQATDGVISLAALGANAEISAYNPATGYLYTVGGGSGAIVVSDLRDPANPQAVARATSTGNGETLQSAAVFGNLLAVAVQNAVKTDPGFVQFYDLSDPALPVHISTVTVGALPDMVKFSSDGTKLLVTNEGEPNSVYTIDPVGSISLINTSGYLASTPVAPAAADVQTVGFEAWESRRAELINRGVRIGTRLGVTTSVAQDIEPEAIAFSADGNTAWISLQENNAIAVLDLSGAAPVISSIFSAGIKDWSRGVASAENFSFELDYAAGTANQPAGVLAGGLSGLFFAGRETLNGTELDVYYAITDRGPNGALIAGQRQFLDPDFQPSIYKLGMNRATGAVTELGRLGLNRPDGTPLTGLPQLAIKDDVPITAANAPLAYDPFGIDSETISLFSLSIGGSTRQVFAVGDEYRGQISIFDAASGNLIQRYIPAGQKAQLAAQHNVAGATPIGAETIDSLPAIYGNRWSNRGIEGMAFNPTDGLLYAFLQSPLDVDANGDGVTEGRSRSELTRILAIDPATGTPVKEHLYLLSGRPGQDKIGDVAFDAARGVFLVMERDSSRSLTGFKHVYEVDLRGATDTLPLTLGTQVGESASPSETFLVGTEGRAVFREVIEAGEQAANGYRFNGIPDGIGVMDNGDGTLRVVVNHEFGATAGDVRAHGSRGAYVSDLTIDKVTLSVLSGKDFLASATDLYLASADGSSWSSGATTAFNRFCSGDLAAATAFRNGVTGYDGRIYLTGEESGAEGRAFAHVLTGSDAGRVYELAGLGNLSFENVVANPLAQAKTVVVSLDDTITNGQVYVYVGNKSATGNAVEQAGLAGGLVYGVRVNSAGTTNTEVGNLASPNETGLGIVAGAGTFELVNLGDVKARTGAELNSESISAGVTNWLRPEDGAWSKDGRTFYFVTTATSTSASRLWALEFTDPANPEAGGTVRMLLNGSEGQVMLDNMTVADDGSILLQEDPGNNARLAKIWRYNTKTDTLVELAQHDPAQFSGAGAITQDEESSGIVDISAFLSGVSGYDTTRYSYFLIADQIHRAVASPSSQVEMGELSVMVTARAGSTGLASWNDALGLSSPELLDNRRSLVDHDSNPATPPIFSTSSADALARAGIRLANKIELFNLPSIGGTLAYDKPEGLTIRDDGAVVINYDNDFGTEGASGNAFTVVRFDGAGFDSSDRDVDGSSGGGNQYRPISGLPLYGLTMPDGIATYTDGQGRSFLLAVGEGDSREYEPDRGNIFTDLTRADANTAINGTPFRNHPGVSGLNAAFATATGISRTRLNLLNDYGDINGDGLIDKPFSIGSRSLRIYDVQGNVVFDSSDALEQLASSLGLMASGRDDDKGTEPEMVEIATVAGRTYAFVALERTTTSVAAVFDVTDPYNVAAVDPVVFPGTERVEGITFLRSPAGEPAGLIASSEGNDRVSVTSAAPLPSGSAFRLQLFHLADQEGGVAALDDAPRLSGVLNALRAQDIDLDGIPGFAGTLTLSSGDAWIPGLFYGAAAQAYGAVGRGDVLIQNALGVQAIAFGNHEFDQGTAVVRDLILANAAAGYPGTAFPYLSGNLNFATDVNLAGLVVPAGQAPRPNSITASVVFDVNGQTVGVVGATTPTLRTISSPGAVGVAPVPFGGTPTAAELDALAAEIQADVDALLAANPGLNKVILLAHMQQISIEQALAERLRHVDIIVAGGSNTRLLDSDDLPRPGDSGQGPYPIVRTDADGKPVAVVNTDGNYKYLGRLVLDFDSQGVIIPGSYDPTISGAFRTDAAGVAALNAEAFIDARVQEVVDNLREVIIAQESEWFGISEVFLNGNRNPGVRSEETNLGNLTADANLAYARQIDPSVVISLKNGGGIRNSIGQSTVPTGSVSGVPELLPTAAVLDAQGNVVKPEGGISRNDIANALSFNNGLSIVSVTPGELKALIEHGIGAGINQGRFPQVGGMAFSYDLRRQAGSRVVNLAIQDDAGNDLDVVVRNGEVVGDPARTIRMVTLDFLASGGDGYPFAALTNPNRVNITQAGSAPRTGVATFAADGSEQDALAEFLAANHSPANPFTAADTPAALDTRLQNLAVRSDSVIDPLITLTGAAVLETLPADTLVGLLSATDPDAGDTFSFSFAPNGNPDGLFRLDGDRLLTTAPLDFEAAATRSVTLRVTDSAGNRYDKAFTITVNDLAEGGAVQPSVINGPGFAVTQSVGGNPPGSVPSGRPLSTGSLGAVQTSPITLPGESEPRSRIENSGVWNGLKTLTLGADYWTPSLGTNLLVANFVDVRWDLSTAPPLDFDLLVVGAKRGAIEFGGGDDTLSWLFHSDGAARSNTTTVSGGGGNDTLTFSSVGRSGIDDLLLADNARSGNGSQWDASYDGGFSTAIATGGAGADRIEGQGSVRLQADGGEGSDVLIGALRNDSLSGGLGEDTLIGGGDGGSYRYAGRGSARRVVLSGGDLIDLNAPGGGGDGAADTVIYDLAGGGVDRIRGFEAGLDRLQVLGGLATAQVAEVANGTFVSFTGRPQQGVLLEGVRGLSVGGAGDIQLLA